MSIFLKNVDRGRLGLNEGLPNDLGSMNRYIFNTQRKRYYLLGGESGTGKTTMLDATFLFAPYVYMKLNPGIKVHWKYYSFEQGREAKENAWGSKVMFNQFGIRLPVAYILSKGKNRISDEHYQLCLKVGEEIEELFEHIDMIDVPVSPSQFKEDMFRYGQKHGTWKTRVLLGSNGKPKRNKANTADLMDSNCYRTVNMYMNKLEIVYAF